MPTDVTVDRRSALKARHRQAIVDAARRLIDAHQGPRFSVDELAAEADVSRRTVFNHFDSLDDVILAACTEILDAVVASFREAATASVHDEGGVATVFEEIVQAVRRPTCPQLTAYLWSALGGLEAPADRQQRFMQVALSRVADDLTLEVLHRVFFGRAMAFFFFTVAPFSVLLKARTLRLKKSMGLVELGRHTGLSPAMLSKLERGKLFPTLPTLLRIAMVFGIGLDFFFSDERRRHVVSIVRKRERLRFRKARDRAR